MTGTDNWIQIELNGSSECRVVDRDAQSKERLKAG